MLPRAKILWLLERLSPSKRVNYLGNSCAVADFVSKTLSVPKERFSVIYNGINTSRFDIPEDSEGLKEALGIEC